MSSIIHNEAFKLLQQSDQAPSILITDAHILSLPEPVQRYLRYAQVIGKKSIHTIHLKQQGFMRQQPDQKWLPLVAEQYFTTKPPAFLWHGTIQPAPLVSISATDRFSNGHGNMLVKLWSFVTLGNAHGPEMDQGALQRYMGEMVWFPTAWLSDDIQWQVIDAHSVKATLRQQSITASVVLHMNEQGQVTHLTAERYMSERGYYRLEPWSVQATAYQEVSGILIPTKVEVMWHLASGDFSWFRVEFTEIGYNQCETTKW